MRPNYFVADRDGSRRRALPRPCCARSSRRSTACSSSTARACSRPTGVLGAQLIGTVGEITAERLKQLGAPYRVGDHGRARAACKPRSRRASRAGRPATVVIAVGDEGRADGEARSRAASPQPVALTIDPHVQQAAEHRARRRHRSPPRSSRSTSPTGQIRAVVSKPDNGFDRALDGTYPPGSTFKVITSTALLAAGRHRLDARAVPADDHRRRRAVHELRGRGVGRARPRARVPDLVQQRVHRPRRQAPDDALAEGRRVVRLQREVVAAGPVVRRHVPDAEATAPSSRRRRSARAASSRARCRWRRSRPRSRRASGTRPSLTTAAAADAGRRRPRSTRRSSRRCASFMASVVAAGRHRGRRRAPGRRVRQDRHRGVRQRRTRRRRTRGSSATAATSRSR